MDELLIEDKKYVSSKRAAKMTGYAKDYIGQLCREGRVPARLVGRSWYVLESAIADHRFGDEKSPQELQNQPQIITPPRELPRYEVPVPEDLPPPRREVKIEQTPLEEKISDASQGLQDSWKAWFDRKITEEATIPAIQEHEETQDKPREVEEAVNIPIHTVYELPPEDLLPRYESLEQEIYAPEEREMAASEPSRLGYRAATMMFSVVAVITITLAALSTGIFDTYVSSNKAISAIAGITVHNK